jgi:hypothetical protein
MGNGCHWSDGQATWTVANKVSMVAILCSQAPKGRLSGSRTGGPCAPMIKLREPV